MIDRHAVHALLKAGQSTKEIARQFRVSQRTVQRVSQEPRVEDGDDARARHERAVGRPGVAPELRDRLRELIAADPEAPPLELLRQLREEGRVLGESTFYRIYHGEKGKLPSDLMVRFEGVAGEFAQFDFGQSDIRLLDGRKQRIHFAAYRLKYSRWPSVVIVPDERVESLVRALLLSFERAGGLPLRVVFDNPKTVVLGRDEHGRPRWNQTLAQVAIDYGFTIELCTPRRPEQKGSVENLVGWVKRAFFRARRFADLEHDLPRQLLEWLTVVSEERPSRATGVIPAERLKIELERMKPLPVISEKHCNRRVINNATGRVDNPGPLAISDASTRYRAEASLRSADTHRVLSHPIRQVSYPTDGIQLMATSYLGGQLRVGLGTQSPPVPGGHRLNTEMSNDRLVAA